MAEITEFEKQYPYKRDPREGQISLENHCIWEENNRVEPMWQWGARITDFCGTKWEDAAKNPIVEAIKNMTVTVSGNTSGGTITPEEEDVIFYYASINRNSGNTDIVMELFSSAVTKTNIAVTVPFVAGNPDNDDLTYIKKNGNTNAAKIEIEKKKANAYYFLIPKEFNYDAAMNIKEEGLVKHNEELERDITMNGCPEGYTLMRIDDIDNFNAMWPTVQTATINYEITFIKKIV